MASNDLAMGHGSLHTKLKRQTLSQAVEARLRSEIIQGIHEPGAMLTEPVLAAELGVSRSPIREALLILERDGIVEFDDRGRTRVVSMTAADFEDLYFLRLAVEPMLAVHAAKCATESDYAAWEANVTAMENTENVAEISQLDIEFHSLIVKTSQRPRMIAAWRSIRPTLELWLAALHRKHEQLTGRVREITMESHLELIEILRTGESEAIRKMIQNHIEGWYKWLPEMDDLA